MTAQNILFNYCDLYVNIDKLVQMNMNARNILFNWLKSEEISDKNWKKTGILHDCSKYTFLYR